MSRATLLLLSVANSRPFAKFADASRRRALPSCPESARTYNAPMLDIKLIRERPDFVRQRLATRGAGDEARIDEVLKSEEQ